MLEIYQLEELIALADLGTISKAADRIGVSQPAMSRAMKNLEDELSVPIFKRGKNTIELTETGEVAVEQARRVLDDIKNLKDAVIRADRKLRTILIGSVAPAPLWKATSVLSSIYPEMTIAGELKEEETLIAGLRAEMYQFIFTTKPVEAKGIHTMKVLEEKLFFALPRNHKFANRKSLALSDLDGENMVLLKNIGIWENIPKKMPHSKFFIQEDRTALTEIAEKSTLPSFASNFTTDGISANRILIPISDPEARITFFVSAKNKDSTTISRMISDFRQ